MARERMTPVCCTGRETAHPCSTLDCDLKPELEQFAVDAWRAPKRIFDAHPPDQCAQLRVDLQSPRPPTPVSSESRPCANARQDSFPNRDWANGPRR